MGEKLDGRVLKFPSSSPNDLGVTVYDPLGGVPVAYLEVLKKVSCTTGKHLKGPSFNSISILILINKLLEGAILQV
jgi:hypothetical protein